MGNPLLIMEVTSPFGVRWHPVFKQYRHHDGVDLRANSDGVFSPYDGVIQKVASDYAYGNIIFINHGLNTLSFSAHLAKPLVTKGDVVKRGELIAISGNTGAYTTGPHLHFGIKFNGKWVDPMKFTTYEETVVSRGNKNFNAVILKGKTYVEARPFAISFGQSTMYDSVSKKSLIVPEGPTINLINQITTLLKGGEK